MSKYSNTFAHTVAARKQRLKNDAAKSKARASRIPGGAGHAAGARASGDAGSWFNTPSARRARIMEVDDRIAQMQRDVDLATSVPPELRTQWNDFRTHWEDWIDSLSYLGVLMPSTEEWANRNDEQLEEFRKRFEAAGIQTNFVARPAPTTEKPGMDAGTKILIGVTIATLGLGLFYALKRPTVVNVPVAGGSNA